MLQSNSSYKSTSSFDVWSVETAIAFLSSVLDGVYRGLWSETVRCGSVVVSIVVSIVVTSVVNASDVVVGYNLVVRGFLKGLRPLKGLLLRPGRPLVPPGLCLTNQLSGSPPDPDDMASSGLSLEGGLTVGGEGRVWDSGGVSAVVEDLE